MKPKSMLIIDGYVDEPGGLGVPPYIDVYPRYIAGAAWLANPDAKIVYTTVDEFRSGWSISEASKYDVAVFIAGVVVPGRYIGANPARAEEIMLWSRVMDNPLKVLVGPAAKWGLGSKGGERAVSPREFRKSGIDVLVLGDVEHYFYDLFKHGYEKADPYYVRGDYTLVDKAAILGARIVSQHPYIDRNLTAEIETYRGCARWVSGGCSFCVEPLRGRPLYRDPYSIALEVRALRYNGVRHVRLGRQADILVYGSSRLGDDEWPKPDPIMLRRLFHGIRSLAPGLMTLHIDNVNPGTISRHKSDSIEALKTIIEYHTPGDVAAMGVETADDRVAKLNNLNTTASEAMEAVRIINKIGGSRGWNGMPELLPGINFILGLPGETRDTYKLNREFLETILEEGLMVRRVNIRKLLVIPTTRAARMNPRLKRAAKYARGFTRWVRDYFDRVMLERVTPRGTVLRGLWVEECTREGYCYARQAGSYPLLNVLRCKPKRTYIDEVVVTGVHSGRSIESVPLRYTLGDKSFCIN